MSVGTIRPFRPIAPPPFVPQEFEKKFAQVNAAECSSGLSSRVSAWIGLQKFQYWLQFHWETHFSAEYLGKGIGAANYFRGSLGSTVDLLQKMPSAPVEITRALEYAKKIEDEKTRLSIPFSMATDDLAPCLQRDVKALDLNQYIAIPCNFASHSTLMAITCIGKDKQGEKTYAMTLHNTGDGLERYHYSKTCSDGKVRFQTAFAIDQIPQATLCFGPFFAQMLNLGTSTSVEGTQTLYEEIFPLLRGKILPPSQNPQLWGHGQIGGTCTTLCILSFIRSQSSHEWFKQFRDYGRLQALLNGYTEIKQGTGNFSLQKLITLEMICTLERSFAKRGIQLSPALDDAKQQLIALSDPTPSLPQEKRMEAIEATQKTASEAVQVCVSCIRDGYWKDLPELLEKAAAHLTKKGRYAPYTPASAVEKREGYLALEQLKAFYNDRILTAQQMYNIAGVAGIALHSKIRLTESEKSFCEELVYQSMYIKDKIAGPKKTAAQKLLNSLYRTWQGKIDEVDIPEGQKQIQRRMDCIHDEAMTIEQSAGAL